MLDKRQRRMTPEEFYAWQEPMDEKYELVDGYPVPRCPDIEMMTGASRRHDRILVNIISILRSQLRGTSCRPFTADTAVRTLPGTRRRPDVGVECGRMEDDSFEAGEVRLLVEVLSPSTREFNHYGKLEEYKSIPTMLHVLLVEPNAPQIGVWSRADDIVWRYSEFEGLEATISLDSPAVRLALAEVYADLSFRPAPKLVEDRP
jgi:Uma2 family endonuclease